MLWVKSFHIVFLVAWYAGLFYLPRLFVYHAMADDEISRERFKVMERKLYRGIMMPCMVLTLALGTWLWLGWGFRGGWLHAKLTLWWCSSSRTISGSGLSSASFARDANTHSHVFFRWINEIPLLYLVAIVILVVVKPF